MQNSRNVHCSLGEHAILHLIVQRHFKSLCPSKNLRTIVLLDKEAFLVAEDLVLKSGAWQVRAK